MNLEFISPIAALVLWTSVVLYWMISARWPLVIKKFGPFGVPNGFRGHDLEGDAPDRVMWKSHNYTNLFEQPTIFYAIAFAHCLLGSGDFDLKLVWAYVILRVLHSIWQSAINIFAVRTMLFMLSDMIIVLLAIRALLALHLA